MSDWENYKGIEIPEATPTGAAGLRLKDNFIYVADQLDSLSVNALSVTNKSSNYTAASGDLVVCDVSGGSFTVSLPAITANARIGIKLGTASAGNSVTIVPNGTEEIDQQSSLVLSLQNDYVQVHGDAANGQWLITQNDIQPYAEVWVHTPGTGTAGFGTTNTNIRRYTVMQSSVGTAITYADSSTLGNSFTINEPGLYFVIRSDRKPSGTGNGNLGLSINSNQLSTSVAAITVTNRLGFVTVATGPQGVLSVVTRCKAGDIIRAHDGGVKTNGTDDNEFVRIMKIGN
jgi:hypothetical protein